MHTARCIYNLSALAEGAYSTNFNTATSTRCIFSWWRIIRIAIDDALVDEYFHCRFNTFHLVDQRIHYGCPTACPQKPKVAELRWAAQPANEYSNRKNNKQHPAPSPSQFNQSFQTFYSFKNLPIYTKIYRHSQTTILLTSDYFHQTWKTQWAVASVSTGPFYSFNIDMAIGHQVYFLKSQKVSGIIRFDGCQN